MNDLGIRDRNLVSQMIPSFQKDLHIAWGRTFCRCRFAIRVCAWAAVSLWDWLIGRKN